MRVFGFAMIVVTFGIATAASAQSTGADGAAAAAAAALAPPPPAAARPTTAPTTLPFSFDEPTTHAASRPAEPSPADVLKKLFDAITVKDVDGCRPLLLDPPDDRLELWDLLKPQARILVRKTATRDILEEKEQGEIAIVIFRDTPKDGSAPKYATLLLAHRYSAWKVITSASNQRHFTPGEKQAMIELVAWGNGRVRELSGTPSTQPATPPVR